MLPAGCFGVRAMSVAFPGFDPGDDLVHGLGVQPGIVPCGFAGALPHAG